LNERSQTVICGVEALYVGAVSPPHEVPVIVEFEM
jgi:hypothetical protein